MAPLTAKTLQQVERELLEKVEWTRNAFSHNATEGNRRDFEEALEEFKDFTLFGQLPLPVIKRMTRAIKPH